LSPTSFWSPLTMSQREVLKIRRNNIVDKPFFPNTFVPNFPNFYFAAKKGIELRLGGRRRSLLAKLRTVGWVRPCR